MTIRPLIFSLFCIASFNFDATAEKAIFGFGADEKAVETLESVSAVANVTNPAGLVYEVETTYWHPQKAFFTRKDQSTTLGIWGRYIWQYDGEQQIEVAAETGEFVLGHQFQATLIHFQRLHTNISVPKSFEVAGELFLKITAERNGEARTLLLHEDNMRPSEMILHRENADDVKLVYADWRNVQGMSLPYAVTIHDGKDIWQYDYSEVRINDTEVAAHYPPYDVLSDEQKLIKLHQDSVDAHLLGRAVTMQPARWAHEFTTASAGEIYRSEQMDSSSFYERMFNTREHITYDDLTRPIVKISDDGTLGWIIVQIHATGIRLDENRNPTDPLDFTGAWVSLYEKVDGDWQMSGNVSNFKPQIE